jgi:hypothetical protein
MRMLRIVGRGERRGGRVPGTPGSFVADGFTSVKISVRPTPESAKPCTTPLHSSPRHNSR